MVVVVSCERELFVSVVDMSAATRVRVDIYMYRNVHTHVRCVLYESKCACVCVL